MPTGWIGLDSRRRLPTDWEKRKQRVHFRAGGRCEHVMAHDGRRCPSPGRDVDHVVEWADGGSDDDSNLQLLCAWHHKQKTSAHAGKKSQSARRRRKRSERPAHPGLIG